MVDDPSHIDFDEQLLPEDSFEPDNKQGIYEVEQILDHRTSRIKRTSRMQIQYLIKWKGYEKATWEPEDNLTCGGLLFEYHQQLRLKTRQQCVPMEIQEL